MLADRCHVSFNRVEFLTIELRATLNWAISVHTLAHGQEKLQMSVLLKKKKSSSLVNKRIIVDLVSVGIGGCFFISRCLKE